MRLEVDVDDPRFGQTVPCACKAREIEDKKLRGLLDRSNLQALQDKTFATFRPQGEHQQNTFDRAREFAERPEGWFVLLGSLWNISAKVEVSSPAANCFSVAESV